MAELLLAKVEENVRGGESHLQPLHAYHSGVRHAPKHTGKHNEVQVYIDKPEYKQEVSDFTLPYYGSAHENAQDLLKVTTTKKRREKIKKCMRFTEGVTKIRQPF